ncbi:MAG TPA: bacteriohopanetetrol glucosamine biosynthesis glycosyltransferase HpnI [Terriglobales bacterium]|nr:bacteriohopanetetrol glucosamine biosynthesis glycosyltransferase HpnI [Terriglobales bacterium]
MFSYLLLTIAGIGTLSSTVFLALALLGRRHYHQQVRARSQDPAPSPLPPVSVLKPVHGMEPRLRENLESFFRIDYPAFELIFCARTRDDAALQMVDQLSSQYTNIKISVLTSGEPPWPNAKIYSLSSMVAAAQHDILVISDSDVEVSPDYLHEVTRPFADSKVGMTTCLYRGLPTGGLWSRLEALGMSVEMTSGVLIANMLEGMKFALGPTMAIRKPVLQQIGGVAPLGEFCSDDFLFGNLTAAAGHEVILSEHVIDHIVLNRDWSASWKHQVRWMKSTRCSRPKGHFGTGLTFAMPFGIIGLIAGLALGRPWLGIGLLAWAVSNRVIQSIAIGGGVVKDPRAVSDAWLYPLRDLLGFFFWMASYGSRVIDWRGEKYRMEDGGKMVKVSP